MCDGSLAIPTILFSPAQRLCQCRLDVFGLSVPDGSGVEDNQKGMFSRGFVVLLVNLGQLEECDFDTIVMLIYICSVRTPNAHSEVKEQAPAHDIHNTSGVCQVGKALHGMKSGQS
jgi:hypothetical protein